MTDVIGLLVPSFAVVKVRPSHQWLAPAQGEVFRQSAFARLAASIKLSVVFERNFLR